MRRESFFTLKERALSYRGYLLSYGGSALSYEEQKFCLLYFFWFFRACDTYYAESSTPELEGSYEGFLQEVGGFNVGFTGYLTRISCRYVQLAQLLEKNLKNIEKDSLENFVIRNGCQEDKMLGELLLSGIPHNAEFIEYCTDQATKQAIKEYYLRIVNSADSPAKDVGKLYTAARIAEVMYTKDKSFEAAVLELDMDIDQSLELQNLATVMSIKTGYSFGPPKTPTEILEVFHKKVEAKKEEEQKEGQEERGSANNPHRFIASGKHENGSTYYGDCYVVSSCAERNAMFGIEFNL